MTAQEMGDGCWVFIYIHFFFVTLGLLLNLPMLQFPSYETRMMVLAFTLTLGLY